MPNAVEERGHKTKSKELIAIYSNMDRDSMK